MEGHVPLVGVYTVLLVGVCPVARLPSPFFVVDVVFVVNPSWMVSTVRIVYGVRVPVHDECAVGRAAEYSAYAEGVGGQHWEDYEFAFFYPLPCQVRPLGIDLAGCRKDACGPRFE